MLVLAAVTALVYLLVQGVDPVADDQQTPAGTDVAQTSPGESETNSDEPQLWPVSSSSETLNESPGPEPVARTQDTPADTIPPPMLAPSFDAPSGAVPTENGTEQIADRAAVSDGPLLSWQGEPPAEAANVEPVEPVQGWPPEMGTSSDSTLSPRSVAPYDRAAYSPANSAPWPVSQNDRQQSDENAVQSATLNGTIDLSQPRVDYDRTRSGIY